MDVQRLKIWDWCIAVPAWIMYTLKKETLNPKFPSPPTFTLHPDMNSHRNLILLLLIYIKFNASWKRHFYFVIFWCTCKEAREKKLHGILAFWTTSWTAMLIQHTRAELDSQYQLCWLTDNYKSNCGTSITSFFCLQEFARM